MATSAGLHTLRRRAVLSVVVAIIIPAASAADAQQGKSLFTQQCLLCHSAQMNDNGGGQGPNLHDVVGRSAARDAQFSYTAALRNSNLVWDPQMLDRFLQSPTTLVPGTSMVVAVAAQPDRENLIAYLQTQSATEQSAAPAQQAAKGDWTQDQPGRVHHIKVADLPAPFATPSARNSAQVVSKPADAKLHVPPGFKVELFTDQLQGPRQMITAPNGDIFVAETRSGRIRVLRPSKDGSKVERTETYVEGLEQPFGLALQPQRKPEWLYVAELNRVVRYRYRKGDLKARNDGRVIVPELTPGGTGGHSTRGLAFSRDGKRMFVSIGSMGNIGENMSKKSPAETADWANAHALGAAWDKETQRAAVMVYDVGSTASGKLFATGIRNCVGLSVQPATGEVWCATNERDGLGDDLVPDYVTRVKEGGFYGWPWYYLGAHEDPRHAGERPDLRDHVSLPDVLLGAHSAALSITFYNATQGASLFPKEYAGDGFAVLHGSWNRGTRTGHKVVRIPMQNHQPTGAYEDFLTGFIIDDATAWGRPVASAVASDGSLLLSDDGANLIYRISFEGR
jgi:hypothetical protein